MYILIVLEVLLAYLLLYSIKKINKWVIDKQELIDDFSVRIPEDLNEFREEIKKFNLKLKNKFIPQPLNAQEFGSIVGEIIFDVIKAKLPIGSLGKKFTIVTVFMKLWKYRHRIRATLAG